MGVFVRALFSCSFYIYLLSYFYYLYHIIACLVTFAYLEEKKTIKIKIWVIGPNLIRNFNYDQNNNIELILKWLFNFPFLIFQVK